MRFALRHYLSPHSCLHHCSVWSCIFLSSKKPLVLLLEISTLQQAQHTAFTCLTVESQTSKQKEYRSPVNEVFVLGIILENPSMYRYEVFEEISESLHISVSPSSICHLLRVCEITRKNIRQVALQRCAALRGAYTTQCLMFRPDMFVFVDETGSDRRNCMRKYGYALWGMTPTTHRLLHRGTRAIAGIATSGSVALHLVTTTVTGKISFDFAMGSNPKPASFQWNQSNINSCDGQWISPSHS